MSGRAAELLIGPMRAVRRAGLLWAASLAALVALTVAFWPAFKGSTSMADILDQMPQGLVKAFGMEGFGTAAGYLRGNLYALFVPLLLAGAGVGFANSLTASEEDSGRFEILLAQPVSHRAVFFGRAVAVFAWICLLTLVTAAIQLVADPIVDLSVQTDRLASTLLLCGLLALFHAGLCLAIAGARARPATVLGVGLFVAFAGCTVAALFPLSQPLEPLAHLSPWDWALAGDPLLNSTEAWRYLALGVPAAGLALLGVFLFGRRDIRSA
jgi:ABC-2 type transport system permease protein